MAGLELITTSEITLKHGLTKVDRITHQLWSKLMEPVISHLQQNNFQKAILIPTSLLSLLPLHAAWKEDKQAKSGRKYALLTSCTKKS